MFSVSFKTELVAWCSVAVRAYQVLWPIDSSVTAVCKIWRSRISW
ncbi:hypothetical protein ACHAXS_004051, partial [Conticribra weissflogii]